MYVKNFEQIVPFYEAQLPNGDSKYIPLIQTTFITPEGSRISLSLLFDTGADITTLSSEFYHIFGLTSWDQGQRVDVAVAGGVIDAYQYPATIEVFGKIIDCPIQLIQMPPHPLLHGLLGRDTIFNEFGFGFWENSKELFVTTDPA